MTRHIGIYNANMRLRGGGEKRTLVMADFLSRHNRVTLIVREAIDTDFLSQYFGVDLSRVNTVVVGKQRPDGQLQLRDPKQSAIADLILRYREFHAMRALQLDLLINNSAGSKLVCPCSRGIFMCMFPHQPRSLGGNRNKLLGLAGTACDMAAGRTLGRHPHAYRSYSTVTANSTFTAEWVRRYWGVQAEVVYSVCDPIGAAGKKERIILMVGRFQPDARGMHPKNQATLIEVYKGMPDLPRNGWQLHLAGSRVDDDPATSAYIADLQAAAKGFPIFFHCNASRSDLFQLYRRASIYWHATGYGYSAQEHPAKQEHFGITTVEAMSAGCVPVVINTGGQRESVQHGINGLLWDDLDGLTSQTRQLIESLQWRQQLSDAAVNSCARFTREAFIDRIQAITERLLA